jgi:hypothetical protein
MECRGYNNVRGFVGCVLIDFGPMLRQASRSAKRGEQSIAGLGCQRRRRGGRTHDTLHGHEGRSRPGQHQRGAGRSARIQLVRMKSWRLLCITRRQANLDGLRSDDHTIDIALDQVAIHPVGRKLQRSKVGADTVQHKLLDVGCRHACDAAGLLLSKRNENLSSSSFDFSAISAFRKVRRLHFLESFDCMFGDGVEAATARG